MSSSDRILTATATVFVLIGLLMLAINFIPGADLAVLWPLALIVISCGLLVPSLISPAERKNFAAFFIPALLICALGLIFLYNKVTGDWKSWTYAWLLIPTAVGTGIALAARHGGWGTAAQKVGVWMALCGLAMFALFGLLFGTQLVRIFISFLLIFCGALILLPAGKKREKKNEVKSKK
ncbi:MAG TPA: hypothetical protein PKN24_01375 [bacterium]|nr:hypothetical protein [bacterium]